MPAIGAFCVTNFIWGLISGEFVPISIAFAAANCQLTTTYKTEFTNRYKLTLYNTNLDHNFRFPHDWPIESKQRDRRSAIVSALRPHHSMKILDLTLPTPAENLALEEALLEHAEQTEDHPEVLRFWESPQTFVILGRGSKFAREVNHDYCEQNNIPILRRCSGGATVVAGRGCLMYSLLLSYVKRPELRMLDYAHKFVMDKLLAAIKSLQLEATMQGTCDLVHKGRKFSGNALRCKRNFMLYHGTILIDMPISEIADCLEMPERQPDYRNQRSHRDFIGLLPAEPQALKNEIAKQWSAVTAENEQGIAWHSVHSVLTQQLTEKYRAPAWTQRV